MQLLNKSLLAQGYKNFESLGIDFHNNNKPEKILQFGEGNFLRAFVDAFIDELNEKNLFNGSVVIVPPIAQTTATVDVMNAQDCCYTVVLRGLENNVPVVRRRIVTCVSRALNMYKHFSLYMDTMMNPDLRFIVSNTTEAGIVFLETDKPNDAPTEPPVSFPAKITALLYERYKIFNGAADKGFIFIPCELIDNNGSQLKKFVLRHANNWELPQKFIDWVKNCNHFTNTLVDRIVTGYPKDEIEKFENELGYRDNLLVTGELFHFFAIEAENEVAKEISETLPFNKAGLNVVLTKDATPYKLRKVRILNGAHTMAVLAAYLGGKDTVGEMMKDSQFVKFIRKGIYEEIIPSLIMPPVEHEGLIEKDLISFADSVFERFANPYIKHYLLSIALNSVSKFKARVLPSILEYYKKTGKYPKALTLSFAALLAFYKGTEREYEISDSEDVLEFFAARRQGNDIVQFVEESLSNVSFWGADLTSMPGFSEAVSKNLRGILYNGVKCEIEKIIGDEL